MGKVESPEDPPGTTTRKRDVRFTGFSVLLGNTEALTHSCTTQSFVYKFSGNTPDGSQMLSDILPFLRKQSGAFHTQANSNLYSHTCPSKTVLEEVTCDTQIHGLIKD